MALTESLQSEAKDIVQAMSEIDNLVSVLQDQREKVDESHDQWFTEVEHMSTAIGTQASLPRLCGRQTRRSNTPSQTPKEYYRRNITIPLLDHILSELASHFNKHQQTALMLIPYVLVTKTLAEVQSQLAQLRDMYSDDLPCPISFKSEVHTWYLKWTTEKQSHGSECLPTSLSFTLPHASCLFPSIKELLHILSTLPVTSCSAERSFSGLKRIKTVLRSTTSNEHLTSTALLHIHRDIDIDIPKVIDEFARLHPKVHSRSPFQMKNLHNFGVLGPISILLVPLAF